MEIKGQENKIIINIIKLLVSKEKELILKNYIHYCLVNNVVYDINIEILIRNESSYAVEQIIKQPLFTKEIDKKIKEKYKIKPKASIV